MDDQRFEDLKAQVMAAAKAASNIQEDVERITAAREEDPPEEVKATPTLNIEDVTKALVEALAAAGIDERIHWYTPLKGSLPLSWDEIGPDQWAEAVGAIFDLSPQANLRKITPPQAPIFDGYRVSIVNRVDLQRVDVAAFAFADFIPGVNVAYSEIGLHRETMAFNVTEVTPDDLARWAAAVANYCLHWAD